MVVEKFSDLVNVTNNMLVDLSALDIKLRSRAISFLAGLTFKNGKLLKIARDKFLVFIEA